METVHIINILLSFLMCGIGIFNAAKGEHAAAAYWIAFAVFMRV